MTVTPLNDPFFSKRRLVPVKFLSPALILSNGMLSFSQAAIAASELYTLWIPGTLKAIVPDG